MATPIKRIEKEFMLKTLFDEQIPIMHLCDRTEYILKLERPAKNDLCLKTDRPIAGLKSGKKLDLMFESRGQIITFTAEVTEIDTNLITASIPEFLYKNLDRTYSRVATPQGMRVQFTFQGDRYALDFPKVKEFEKVDIGELKNTVNLNNLQGIITQMGVWINSFASGYKVVIFKDVKPQTAEEKILAHTGKTFFITSTAGNFVQSDPHPKKRLITEEMFCRFLESTGIDPLYSENAVSRFVKQKAAAGIISDVWVPILFHEYVIGYIHVWNSAEGKPPFDISIIDTLYQFAGILALSLKTNGVFNSGLIKNEPFEGKITDISASGLLFSYPLGSLSNALLPDSELAVKLTTPKRTIQALAKIVRRYKDNTNGYFGCRFTDMAPEDMRFLFEFLYGKTFNEAQNTLVSGQV